MGTLKTAIVAPPRESIDPKRATPVIAKLRAALVEHHLVRAGGPLAPHERQRVKPCVTRAYAESELRCVLVAERLSVPVEQLDFVGAPL